MKMRKILLIILTISSLKVAGQNHILGIKGGVSQTNVSAENFLTDNKFRAGISSGMTYEYILKKYFTLGADIIYNQRGFINYIIFTDQSGNPTGRKEPTYFNYDYISIPVKAGFNIGNKIYGFANIGVCPSVLIDAKIKLSTFDSDANVIGTEIINVTDKVSKFDFSGIAELGGGYKFKDRFWLYTSIGYQHSFTTITNSDYFANSKIKHYGMTLTVGLKYVLTKE